MGRIGQTASRGGRLLGFLGLRTGNRSFPFSAPMGSPKERGPQGSRPVFWISR